MEGPWLWLGLGVGIGWLVRYWRRRSPAPTAAEPLRLAILTPTVAPSPRRAPGRTRYRATLRIGNKQPEPVRIRDITLELPKRAAPLQVTTDREPAGWVFEPLTVAPHARREIHGVAHARTAAHSDVLSATVVLETSHGPVRQSALFCRSPDP